MGSKPRPGPPDTRVLIIGMMGAGKSTVGHALAALTGWPYLDNDQLVRRVSGMTARELLAAKGEAQLRAAESAALRAVYEVAPPLVASVAAGTVARPADRALLARGDAFVVWLRARLDTLARRVGGTARPWLDGDPAAALGRLYADRARWYAQVASLIVDVDELTPNQVATVILDELTRRRPRLDGPDARHRREDRGD